MKTLIYLHGFNSSPQSEKARLTCQFFEAQSAHLTIQVPELPASPSEAVAKLDTLVQSIGLNNLAGFIGSSLGGYYSLYFQQRYKMPVVLINPAIKPYTLLLDYLGENVNLYTGERYIVEETHMVELKALEATYIATAQNTFLLTQTSDEVLAYQQAVSHLKGAKMWIQFGGSHAFDDFNKVLPAIKNFFEVSL